MTQATVSNLLPGQMVEVLRGCQLQFVRVVPEEDFDCTMVFIHLRTGKPFGVKASAFYARARARLVH